MSNIQQALEQFVQDTANAVFNYELGIEYHKIGNSAAAISYFLRAAELTDDDNLAYTCLLLNAINFRKQGRRSGSLKNQLLHAIALCPTRPEAYFLLSRYYQEYQAKHSNDSNRYHESYSIAEMGLKLSNVDNPNPILEYKGAYCLVFQKAVAAWWISKQDESRRLFLTLLGTEKMDEEYKAACLNNLKNIGLDKLLK